MLYCTHVMVFQTVIGPQMASEKNGQRQFKFFWSLRQGGGCIRRFFKAKNDFLWPGQQQFCPFWEALIKIKKTFCHPNFLFVDFFKVKEDMYLQIFKRKYSFLRSLWFFDIENFAANVAKFADFLKWAYKKIYLIDSNVSIFGNRK